MARRRHPSLEPWLSTRVELSSCRGSIEPLCRGAAAVEAAECRGPVKLKALPVEPVE